VPCRRLVKRHSRRVAHLGPPHQVTSTRIGANRTADAKVDRADELEASPPAEALTGRRRAEREAGVPARAPALSLASGLLSKLAHGHVPVPRASGLAATEAKTQLELGEQDDVRTGALRELERLAATRRAEDVETVVSELPAEELARLGLGFGDEDGARHAGDASPVACPPPDVLCGGLPTSLPQPSVLHMAARAFRA